MSARRDRVYPDTATLYPISVADLILQLGEIGIFDVLWSDYLLDEVERVLVEGKGLGQRAARYFCECIRETFPDGHIARSSYEHLLATRTGPDPTDHEHSAAASAAGVHVLLSADASGYPEHDTFPARRRHPDAYLTEILTEFPDQVIDVLHNMAASRRELTEVDSTIEALRRAGLMKFSAAARKITDG